jgi:hypothetical protein
MATEILSINTLPGVKGYPAPMKTNRSARKIRKLRTTLFCLATLASTAIAFTMGESLAARFGQTTVCQTEGPQAANVDLTVLMASLR